MRLLTSVLTSLLIIGCTQSFPTPSFKTTELTDSKNSLAWLYREQRACHYLRDFSRARGCCVAEKLKTLLIDQQLLLDFDSCQIPFGFSSPRQLQRLQPITLQPKKFRPHEVLSKILERTNVNYVIDASSEEEFEYAPGSELGGGDALFLATISKFFVVHATCNGLAFTRRTVFEDLKGEGPGTLINDRYDEESKRQSIVDECETESPFLGRRWNFAYRQASLRDVFNGFAELGESFGFIFPPAIGNLKVTARLTNIPSDEFRSLLFFALGLDYSGALSFVDSSDKMSDIRNQLVTCGCTGSKSTEKLFEEP